jgi:hypothetical protein
LAATEADELISIDSDIDNFLLISFEGFFNIFNRIAALAIKQVIQFFQLLRVGAFCQTKINHEFYILPFNFEPNWPEVLNTS